MIFGLMAVLTHAPLPSLGGTVVIYDRNPIEVLSPTRVNTTGAKLLSTSVFETLFATDKNGNVTGELAQDDFSYKNGVLTFKLRPHVFLHNGQPLQHEHIINHFYKLAEERNGPALHIVAPFTQRGSEEINPKLNISYSSESGAFEIVTQPPYPDIMRLLSTSRSAISVEGLGTGPFKVTPTKTTTLESFIQFRRGAPYVDQIEHIGNISPFKARAALRSGAADFIFGIDDLDRKTETFAQGNESSNFEDFIVLQVGPNSDDLANFTDLNNLRSVLNRERLVRRYLSERASPATNFFAHHQKLPRSRRFEQTRKVRTMILNKDSVASIRFAERVQFELVKKGLTVKIKSLPTSEFQQKVTSGEFDFALRNISLSQASQSFASSKLHRLLEVASDYGVFKEIFNAKQMSAFAMARREEQSSLLAKLEKDLRESARLVVIAKQVPLVIQRKAILNREEKTLKFEYLEKN
ncbi:MAG: ABC transporter substrate-binding protein [Myxococcota bacterium]|nr:ABC transporter substrate-binding protein [Myxococcota bacterium]